MSLIGSNSIENNRFNKIFYWCLFGIVLLLVSYIRYRLLSFPLERDEGEYAYMGQLMLEGVPPYKFAYNMKLPGTYAMYALILSVFGQTIEGIHIGFLIVHVVSLFMLFYFLKEFLNPIAAFYSVSAYALFVLNPYVLGFCAHATHFIVLFSLPGVILLWKYFESGKNSHLFLSGIFLGLAFLMKQQGILFIGFAGLFLLYSFFVKDRKFLLLIKNGLIIGSGFLIPFIFTVIILYFAGVFNDFKFWIFDYARQYVSLTTPAEGWKNLSVVFQIISYKNLFPFLMILTGLVLQFFIQIGRDKIVFLSLLFFFSFLTTVPGLYFREHYFISFLPFALIFFGVSASSIHRLVSLKVNYRYVNFILIILVFIGYRDYFKTNKNHWFTESPQYLSKITYGSNPFLESVKIAEYIKQDSKPEDKIAVIGSEPEIFFYSNRKSATGYIYMYPLMEDHAFSKQMQKNMIKEINEASPRFIVYDNNAWIYQNGESKAAELIQWTKEYISLNYLLIGIVDIESLEKTRYIFNFDEIKQFQSKKGYSLYIYKRKE